MTLDGKEYRGEYHTYKNGQVWSEGTYNSKSVELREYIETISGGPAATGVYFNLTGTTFDKHILPEYFYPRPTDKDYQKANFARYFCAKINDNATITEIDKDAFQKKNAENKVGIDTRVFKFVELKWSIAGTKEAVERANKDAIKKAAETIPTINEFLGDLTEYYKE